MNQAFQCALFWSFFKYGLIVWGGLTVGNQNFNQIAILLLQTKRVVRIMSKLGLGESYSILYYVQN